ncbi:MAG TPA: biopolymer transporter ExbD [Leptospiraceae bacterium]|nr:biopolymer transporter ExbD [Leptospiraceae bacterium]HNF24611.1 biopolymer transporter ExbD [Leptospiraceae bacterium]HNI26989.1 biopolymer transporter ExbD [Leptospiraceae bacterium]HNI98356.1 biopolymer transporter ExbD [Leptospiraceae bacterium]HNM06800.1 biopolymer transporter ExbD [Leptospiraceae bacterium]
MFKLRRTTKPFDRIDITSLIDVISFIVIYFLVNATLEKGTSIKIELPRSSTSATKEKNPDELIITVNKQGKIFLDKDPTAVPVDKLKDKIISFLGPKEKRDPKKNRVIIKGDGTASYQTVVKVIDEVNAAGVTRFNLAMVKNGGTSNAPPAEEPETPEEQQ